MQNISNVKNALDVTVNDSKIFDRTLYFATKKTKKEIASQISELIDAVIKNDSPINLGVGEAKLKVLIGTFIDMAVLVSAININTDMRNQDSFDLFEKISNTNFSDIYENTQMYKPKRNNRIENEIEIETALFKLVDSIHEAKEKELGEFKITDQNIAELMAYSFLKEHPTNQQSFVGVIMNTAILLISAHETGIKLIKDEEFLNTVGNLANIQAKLKYI